MDRKHPFGWIVPREWMVDELDEGETAMSVFSVVKRVDETGTSAWSVRTAGDDLSDEERYGAIAAVVHGLRLELQGDWTGTSAASHVDGDDESDVDDGTDGDNGDDGYTAFADLFPIAWVTEPL